MAKTDSTAPTVVAEPVKRTPSEWQALKETPAFEQAVGEAFNCWRPNTQLSEGEYDAGIKAALSAQMR